MVNIALTISAGGCWIPLPSLVCSLDGKQRSHLRACSGADAGLSDPTPGEGGCGRLRHPRAAGDMRSLTALPGLLLLTVHLTARASAAL